MTDDTPSVRVVHYVEYQFRSGEEDSTILCTDCEREPGAMPDGATITRRELIPAACDRCDWRI